MARAKAGRGSGSVVDLGTAVSEIQQACEELGSDGHLSPFFVVAGAGISFPPVPLAPQIVDACDQTTIKYQRARYDGAASSLDAYSEAFVRAYPGARQRQRYLRTLIEKKPLSLASLRLAHLLGARKLTNVVVTTNFDDFVARSLRLFGEEPAVCDHPQTIGRIDHGLPDIQIVHVHGSYLFYDLANLRDEITARARFERQTSFTMMGLLDSLLWRRSPLVIGYSGWQGDIIMSALRRRLRGGIALPQCMYWFCYRRSELDLLPDWLTSSPDIRFVLPPSAAEADPTGGAQPARSVEQPPEPTLPAYEVFDRLIKAFDVGEPAIFSNPVKAFADMLAAALPASGSEAGDPYAFKALVDRLRRAAEAFETATAPVPGIEADLDELRIQMRQSDYASAADTLGRIIPAQLPRLGDTARIEVLGAARLASAALMAKSESRTIDPKFAPISVFDPVLDRAVGDLPRGTVWCFGSRSNQLGFETPAPGGAFTAALIESLRATEADRDGDGRISILEAAIDASLRMQGKAPQNPAIVGEADRLALFAAREGLTKEFRTLRALLIGINRYAESGLPHLRGPVADLIQMRNLLETGDRRLFGRAHSQTLQDGEATRAAVMHGLERLAGTATSHDAIVVYFSGMGIKTRTVEEPPAASAAITLVLHDYSSQSGGGAITGLELRDALARARAKACLVLLDF